MDLACTQYTYSFCVYTVFVHMMHMMITFLRALISIDDLNITMNHSDHWCLYLWYEGPCCEYL